VKTQDKFSMNRVESEELKGVPVIAPVGLEGKTDTRRWIAKNSGRPVHILPPEEVIRRTPGMSDEELEKALEARRRERREIIQEIEREGGLLTTYMTFAELMADYQGHHENKAVDLYGMETHRETRGLLSHSRVKITELDFIGKETILQQEVEQGIVSPEEAENYRFIIRPERDPLAELVHEVLRLLSKAELRRLGINWRMAEKIKSSEGSFGLKDAPRLVADLTEFLRERYPAEIGGAQDDAALQAFVENRKHLLEAWEAIKPRLAEWPTKELTATAGCSKREAIRIKKGEVEPKIEVMRRIVTALSSDEYNSIGE